MCFAEGEVLEEGISYSVQRIWGSCLEQSSPLFLGNDGRTPNGPTACVRVLARRASSSAVVFSNCGNCAPVSSRSQFSELRPRAVAKNRKICESATPRYIGTRISSRVFGTEGAGMVNSFAEENSKGPRSDYARRRTILGFDIGGTKTAVVEGTTKAEILQRIEFPTEACRPFEEIFPKISSVADDLIKEASGCKRDLNAVSVSIGGPLRIQEGVLLDPPHLPGWHHVRLKERLEQRFPGLPISIEHDGNAGALAEFNFGIGRKKPGLKNLVFLTFGTGIGAGLIVNGQIVHGATDTAGELGHWRLAEQGPEGFGKAGSWEGFASGAGLVKLASQMFPTRWHSNVPIHGLVQAMIAGETEATAVLEEAAMWMGRGLALIVDAFNPEVIVLGSRAVLLGDRVIGPARRVVQKEALPQAAAACEILPAALGLQIGDVAALMAALNDPVARIALGCETTCLAQELL